MQKSQTRLSFILAFHCRIGKDKYLNPNFTVQAGGHVRPWPNGVTSRRKFSTWVYLRLRLARPCVHSGWLAMTSVFHRLATQPKSTQVEWCPLTYYQPISGIHHMTDLKFFFFCSFCVLVRKLASPFGHPTQVSTQVQLVATCDYLRVRLTRALRVPVGDLMISGYKDLLLSLPTGVFTLCLAALCP